MDREKRGLSKEELQQKALASLRTSAQQGIAEGAEAVMISGVTLIALSCVFDIGLEPGVEKMLSQDFIVHVDAKTFTSLDNVDSLRAKAEELIIFSGNALKEAREQARIRGIKIENGKKD